MLKPGMRVICGACKDSRYWPREGAGADIEICLRKQGHSDLDVCAIIRAIQGPEGAPLVPCFACNADGSGGSPAGPHNKKFWKPLLDMHFDPYGCGYRVSDPISGEIIHQAKNALEGGPAVMRGLGAGPYKIEEIDVFTRIFTNSSGKSLKIEDFASVLVASLSYRRN